MRNLKSVLDREFASCKKFWVYFYQINKKKLFNIIFSICSSGKSIKTLATDTEIFSGLWQISAWQLAIFRFNKSLCEKMSANNKNYSKKWVALATHFFEYIFIIPRIFSHKLFTHNLGTGRGRVSGHMTMVTLVTIVIHGLKSMNDNGH